VKTLVVQCHPLAESFMGAARERVLAGLAEGGHTVRSRDLYAEDWEHSPDLPGHFADLAWCDALVLVYPTWWAGPPGLLADWIVQCWPASVRRRGITRVYAVSSHGSPKYINALEGEVGKRQLGRWIRPRCAWNARVVWMPLYTIDTCTPAQREQYLSGVERCFAKP
jgi:putative NADPH-quinone reductase